MWGPAPITYQERDKRAEDDGGDAMTQCDKRQAQARGL